MSTSNALLKLRSILAGVCALVLLAAFPVCAETVYHNDFSADIGSEWSNPDGDVTPSGQSFLGQFGNNNVKLSLDSLPTHQYVTVDFDLLIINSWDGNVISESYGPDSWGLSIGETPTTLLFTTFSNNGTGYNQCYPDQAPNGNHLAGTGTAAIDSLGYPYGDTIYKMSFTVPHTASTLMLTFYGQHLEPQWNESWGLSNVNVSTTNPLPEPTGFLVLAVGAAPLFLRRFRK